ncbi:MAG TPA: HNH endonuclease [Burkholderiales bacterium]|nr:HNH endonuclease [Burkholderiales bacterium]
MKFWVGVTDRVWYEYLRERSPDEVNFWQPAALPVARFLAPGVPFLFKLHAPHNFIVGGGFFVRFSALPARLAWEAFREKNGVEDYASLRARVVQYRGEIRGDPEIGCNILNSPFFFEDNDWIPVPETWAPNIVRGRTFDTEENDGLRLWNVVSERLRRPAAVADRAEEARFGAEYFTRARLGQGAFRVLVTEAYDRRCAITGERTLPVLEAAHIKPYSESGPHLVSNGLLLRSDLHILFDDGYLTVTDDMRVEVSGRIKEEFENGRDYYKLAGNTVHVPSGADDQPARDFIRWHNENVFLG